uniref:N-acetylgalactosaminide beta-1,3-galactosyltransferase n=1 Tax=Heterorhabditis bacteriophora TaxID=37862 RepID=A0A1I7XM52_HETBA
MQILPFWETQLYRIAEWMMHFEEFIMLPPDEKDFPSIFSSTYGRSNETNSCDELVFIGNHIYIMYISLARRSKLVLWAAIFTQLQENSLMLSVIGLYGHFLKGQLLYITFSDMIYLVKTFLCIQISQLEQYFPEEFFKCTFPLLSYSRISMLISFSLSEQIPHMNLTSFSIDPKHEKPSYDENCWKLPLTMVVVKRTWTGDLPFVEYFSDVEDPYVPTIALGVNNTERGHCEKTFAILQYFLDHRDDWPDIQWLVLADDDTLLSVPRLLELLTCYDNKQKLIIGERYGFGFSHFGLTGYDYPTGGAGSALV